jgi:hypothetical protein
MGGGAIGGAVNGMPGNGSMMPGGGNGSAMPGNMPAAGGASMGGMPGGAAMPGSPVQAQQGFAAAALNGGQMPGMQQQANPMGGMPGAAPAGNGFPFNQQQQRQLVPTAKAAGYTLEQFYANGFDEARVVQEGYFQYA